MLRKTYETGHGGEGKGDRGGTTSLARVCHSWGRKPRWHLGAPATALLCAQGKETAKK